MEAPFNKWAEENPGAECSLNNGRRALLDHVNNLKPDQTDAQLKGVMGRHLGKARGGVIKPQYARRDCKSKAKGQPTSYSKEESGKYNKKHNKKHKDANTNDAKNRETIVALGPRPYSRHAQRGRDRRTM